MTKSSNTLCFSVLLALASMNASAGSIYYVTTAPGARVLKRVDSATGLAEIVSGCPTGYSTFTLGKLWWDGGSGPGYSASLTDQRLTVYQLDQGSTDPSPIVSETLPGFTGGGSFEPLSETELVYGPLLIDTESRAVTERGTGYWYREPGQRTLLGISEGKLQRLSIDSGEVTDLGDIPAPANGAEKGLFPLLGGRVVRLLDAPAPINTYTGQLLSITDPSASIATLGYGQPVLDAEDNFAMLPGSGSPFGGTTFDSYTGVLRTYDKASGQSLGDVTVQQNASLIRSVASGPAGFVLFLSPSQEVDGVGNQIDAIPVAAFTPALVRTDSQWRVRASIYSPNVRGSGPVFSSEVRTIEVVDEGATVLLFARPDNSGFSSIMAVDVASGNRRVVFTSRDDLFPYDTGAGPTVELLQAPPPAKFINHLTGIVPFNEQESGVADRNTDSRLDTSDLDRRVQEKELE